MAIIPPITIRVHLQSANPVPLDRVEVPDEEDAPVPDRDIATTGSRRRVPSYGGFTYDIDLDLWSMVKASDLARALRHPGIPEDAMIVPLANYPGLAIVDPGDDYRPNYYVGHVRLTDCAVVLYDTKGVHDGMNPWDFDMAPIPRSSDRSKIGREISNAVGEKSR
jgi:hypothetical protein